MRCRPPSQLSWGKQAGTPWQTLIAVAVLVLGLPLLAGGAYLAYLGGPWYFILAGLALTASGVLLLRDSSMGIWLLVAVVAGTLVWSLLEIAAKGWMPAWPIDLLARMGVVTALAILALLMLPTVRRPQRAIHR